MAQSALKVNSIEFKAQYYKHRGQLIDVRTPYEYADGHIENARNIDVSVASFEAEIEKLDRDQAVFIYCGIGIRSAKAAAILRKKGFKYVYDLDGGYKDLVKVGMRSVK
jgi:rhodanese-related sulfurtransferase